MDISHELRTPLSILLIETSAICDKIATCDINAVAALRQDILQIQRLVNDLHSLSELDNNDFAHHLSEVDLKALIVAQLVHFSPLLQARDIKVHNQLTQLPMIKGDAERLIQVVQNIFSNCQKYTEPQGQVWVTQSLTDKELIIAIEDSGPGVDTAIIERLTDRLFRADRSRHYRNGGRGLGLAIASAIMKAHSGQLRCKVGQRGGLCVELHFSIGQD